MRRVAATRTEHRADVRLVLGNEGPSADRYPASNMAVTWAMSK